MTEEFDDQKSTLASMGTGAFRAIATWSCPECGLEVATTSVTCPQDGTPISAQKQPDSWLSTNYEFIGTIGTGGMSVIYKARQTMLDKIVAIKMLHSHLLNEQSLQRFQQEAKAASSLKHPNVIAVHDFGISERGQPYMVMDYIEGITLADLIGQGAVPLPDAMDIFLAVCDALEHAHQSGILHRDLKPSNIMLSQRGDGWNVHLMDFGIAKILDTESGGVVQQLTQTGEVIGSPLYMAPEQCMGRKIDQRSDIYSLGCILYEAVTGTPPHRGESMIDTIFKHLNDVALPLHEARPDISFPEAFEDLVAKLLANKPEDRYQTISQVKEELLNIQAGALQGGGVKPQTPLLAKFKFSKSNAAVAAGGLLAVVGLIALLAADQTVKRAERSMTLGVQQLQKAQELNKQAANAIVLQRPVQQEVKSDEDASYFGLSRLNMERQELYLGGKKVTDGSLLALKKFPYLRLLDLSNTSITDRAMASIIEVKSLETLKLNGTHLSKESLAKLDVLPNIKELGLDETLIDDDTLRSLSKIPKLENLSIRDTAITDVGLGYLRDAKALKELSISGTDVTNAGLAVIGKLPLRTLTMWETKATPGVLEKLKCDKTLLNLHLSRLNLSSDDLAALSHLSNLVYLQLYHMKNLHDDDLRYLTELKSLDTLYIEDCPLTDHAGTYLNRMPSVTKLALDRIPISDSIFSKIGNLKNLSELWIEETQVRDLKGISKFKNLASLYISGSQMTDAGLKELGTLPNLYHLEAKACPNVTRRGIAAFKKMRPGCYVEFYYVN